LNLRTCELLEFLLSDTVCAKTIALIVAMIAAVAYSFITIFMAGSAYDDEGCIKRANPASGRPMAT